MPKGALTILLPLHLCRRATMKTRACCTSWSIHNASGALIILGFALGQSIATCCSAMGDRDREHGKNDPPTWDGNPGTCRPFKDEVRIWTLGQDLEEKYCLEARLIRNLTGAARRAALSIPEADLLATDQNKKAGIQAVIERDLWRRLGGPERRVA